MLMEELLINDPWHIAVFRKSAYVLPILKIRYTAH